MRRLACAVIFVVMVAVAAGVSFHGVLVPVCYAITGSQIATTADSTATLMVDFDNGITFKTSPAALTAFVVRLVENLDDPIQAPLADVFLCFSPLLNIESCLCLIRKCLGARIVVEV